MNSTTSKDLLEKIQVCQEHPELIEQVNQVISDLSGGSRISQIKDHSIGTDQIVFYVRTDSSFEAIIKVPKVAYQEIDESSPNFYSMHLPGKQAWLLKTLENQKDVICPQLLYLDPNGKFFVETFLPEANLGEAREISEDELREIMNDVGRNVKSLHSIKLKKFGNIALEGEGQGKFSNWLDMFWDFFPCLEECAKEINMEETTIQKIKEIYAEQSDYLTAFDDPRLLHADLSFNNTRVCRKNGKWSFSGLIDFADVLSGDPLFDFGELLGDRCGSWKETSLMEETYLDGGKFTVVQRKIIRFYAVYFCLWWITVTHKEKKDIHTKTLYNLLNMEFE